MIPWLEPTMFQAYPSLLNVKRPVRCTFNATMWPVLYSKVLATPRPLADRWERNASNHFIVTVITLPGG